MQKKFLNSGALGPGIIYVIIAIIIAFICIRSGINGLKKKKMELFSSEGSIVVNGTPFLGIIYLLFGIFFSGLSIWGIWDLIKLFI